LLKDTQPLNFIDVFDVFRGAIKPETDYIGKWVYMDPNQTKR
jgi:hypothetical protein